MQTLKCLFAFDAMLAGGLAFGDGFGTAVGEASEAMANFDTRNLKVRKPVTMDEFFNVAWNNTAGWTTGGITNAGAPSATVTIEPMSGTNREDYADWTSAGASKEVVSAPGEGANDVSGHLRRSLYRFTLAVNGIDPLFAYFDFGNAVPEVKPSVEITSVRLRDPRDGTVEYSYKVDGEFEEGEYDVLIKVSVANGTKSTVLTHKSVAGGSTVSTSLNVKTLFGKAYPNVTLFAELKKAHAGVQLWEGGPIFAECNVGAKSPEESGYYFWWDDTVGYTNNGLSGASAKWVSAQDGTTTIMFNGADDVAVQTCYKFPDELMSKGWIDANGSLVVSDDAAKNRDAARVHWGASWRMMTYAELQKLTDPNCCTSEWTQVNTIWGRKVTGKGAYASNSIFLPAAGYGSGAVHNSSNQLGLYWSSTAHMGSTSKHSFHCQLGSGKSFDALNNNNRYLGYSVRPVRDAK